MKSGHHALRWLRRWHARLGVFAIVFFLLLTISGIALNHSGALHLDGRKLHVAWLARWYGLKTDPPSAIYRTDDHVLAWGNGMWLLDGAIIAENSPPPVGMIELSDAIYIASPETILALAPDHRLIEKIPAAALPAVPIGAIGLENGWLKLRTRAGIFESADSISWKSAPSGKTTWSTAQPVPPSLLGNLAEKLVPGVPVLQLISDIHSGRILGKRGSLLVDALGLLLVALGLSGSWVFLRSIRRR